MSSASTKITPMMAQYRALKAELSDDVLLLFRMGDFYEMFFDDAVLGSRLMDITLTRRANVPMAGIPHHALREYLPRVLAQGVKAAIAEQMEDPKTTKGLVKREVIQIITPGTVIESSALDAGQSNFLVSLCTGRGRFGLAFLDISTGDFRLTELDSVEMLEAELSRLQPAECLIPESLRENWEKNGFPAVSHKLTWTPAEDWTFDLTAARDLLLRQFKVASLDGFGCRDLPLGISAAGAVLQYACHNLRREAAHITRLRPYAAHAYMVIDRNTQRNLELVQSLFTDSTDATLLSVLNHTRTPMGARLLREWILHPLLDITRIRQRQDAIEAFTQDQLLLVELREALGAVRDFERIITRMNLGSANARDLLALLRGLQAIPGLRALLEIPENATRLKTLRDRLTELPELAELVARAIVDEPPLTIKEGNLIRPGYHAALDDYRRAATEGKSWIAELQQKEQERTGIRSLKVRYNRVFGYYIEIRNNSLDHVPEQYIRKQTLTNAERFITPELKEIEEKVLGAEDKARALEYELFQELRARVIEQTVEIQETAAAVAEVDVIASLAEAALKNEYRRPEVHEGLRLEIHGGRHPVVDHLMTDERFVPNDTLLDGESNQMVILTGPNMAGKSTYIRQTALLTLLAQMGSFIPAESAKIGIASRIFTRVGAADDLARGQSTFMVEMLESANILNNADARSLIILDEIGRGTSTYDGLSIAWAVAEYLHNTPTLRARTLFATHYHELTQLALTLPGIRNYNVAVRESGEKVIFLRKIVPGAADRSYGIHVARLAGLPEKVIARANEILTNLEGNAFDATDKPKIAQRRRRKGPIDHPTLFDLDPSS